MIRLRRFGQTCHQKLSHTLEIDHKTDIIESYIAPVDFEHGGEIIKQGSWIVAMKIWDKDLWKQTKEEIVGFSAGGTAVILE